MSAASLRRIDNIRRLVLALADDAMGPADVARLLQVSDRAARNYLEVLELAGVGQADPSRRCHLRLHRDPAVVDAYLASLAEPSARQPLSLRRSVARHCTDPGDRFLHVLADDTRFPLDLHRRPAGRDPLVAALFGAAGSSR